MKYKIKYFCFSCALVLFILVYENIRAQSDVSLHYLIGSVDTVSSVEELKAAVNLANEQGNRTILIKNGEYEIASSSWYPYITGTNIMFRSLSGIRDSMYLKGSGMRETSGTENVLHLVGNTITVADLTVGECGNHGICVEGDSILIHNVKIFDTYKQMVKGTDAGDGADYGVIENCLFEYTAGIGPQYYIGGIDIHEGNNWIVRDNEFYHIKSPESNLAEHAIHFWNNSADIIIERNKIVACDRGIGFGLGTSGCTGGIIRNNMVYTTRDVGIGLETSPYTKVYNNSVYTENYHNSIGADEYISSSIECEKMSNPFSILYQNYPNPFNVQTEIPFQLHTTYQVSLKIFNLRGRLINILISRELKTGTYRVDFKANGLESGIYFFQLRSKNSILTKKCLYIK